MTFPSPTWTKVAADDLSQPVEEDLPHWHRDAALSLGLVVPNAYNTLHGGAVAAIAEAIGMACTRAAAGDNEMFLGELSTTYLSAARLDVRSASLSISFHFTKEWLILFPDALLAETLHHRTASTAPSWISRCSQRLLLRQPRLRWPSGGAMKRGTVPHSMCAVAAATRNARLLMLLASDGLLLTTAVTRPNSDMLPTTSPTCCRCR
jgi:hypothetical protein